jgi:hypothetical protein
METCFTSFLFDLSLLLLSYLKKVFVVAVAVAVVVVVVVVVVVYDVNATAVVLISTRNKVISSNYLTVMKIVYKFICISLTFL